MGDFVQFKSKGLVLGPNKMVLWFTPSYSLCYSISLSHKFSTENELFQPSFAIFTNKVLIISISSF